MTCGDDFHTQGAEAFMRIAMLTSLFLPSIGGVEAHIYHISQELQARGHHVIILHTTLSEHATAIKKEQLDGLTVYRIVVHAQMHSLLSCMKSMSYVHGFLRKARPVFHTRTLARIVRKICVQENIDIIHQHDFLSNIFTTKQLSHQWPIVLTNHTGEYLLMMRHATSRQVLAFFLRHLSYMIGPSAELCDVSFMKHPIPVQYIANGVDPSRFRVVSKEEQADLRRRYSLPENHRILLCARRWAPTKGVIYLVQAIPHVLEDFPEAFFVISGNDYPGYPEYVSEILSFIREHHLEHAIRLIGDIPHQQMEQYDQMADIVVLPSLLEATSLSGLEAMSCGKPLVATNVGGIPEIVADGENGLLVPPRDPRALSDAIITLLKDAKQAYKMGQRGRERVEQEFSWKICGRKVEDIYRTVLAKTRNAK